MAWKAGWKWEGVMVGCMAVSSWSGSAKPDIEAGLLLGLSLDFDLRFLHILQWLHPCNTIGSAGRMRSHLGWFKSEITPVNGSTCLQEEFSVQWGSVWIYRARAILHQLSLWKESTRKPVKDNLIHIQSGVKYHPRRQTLGELTWNS